MNNNTIQEFHDLIIGLQPINLFSFQEIIPEFQLMADCEQSQDHHAEGDVLIHSQMAANIVLHLMEMEEVKFEDKVSLYLATILHDIGKPSVSIFNTKKNKITAYGHDDVGVPIANEFLKKYFPEFSYKRREPILRLIEWHMKPRMYMKNGTTINKLKQLSLAVNTKLLYLLSQADTLGRTANSMTSSMILLEMYKQNCEDLGIWNKHYRVPLAIHLNNASYSLARWNILMNDALENDATLTNAQTIMNRAFPPFQLMLMVGVPGSGKSTYCKQMLEKYPSLKIISMDEKRKELCGDVGDQSKNQEVFSWQQKELRKAMKNKQSVIVDATNSTRKRRKALWQIARENGALCSAVYFDISLSTLLERNVSREKKVPEDVIKHFYNTQQSVLSYESDQIIVIEK